MFDFKNLNVLKVKIFPFSDENNHPSFTVKTLKEVAILEKISSIKNLLKPKIYIIYNVYKIYHVIRYSILLIRFHIFHL